MKTKNKSISKKQKKIVIGFVGKICSGKGEAASYLRKKYKGDSAVFSQSMRDILDRLYVSQTRENLQKISLLLRQNFGGDIFSKTMVGDIERSKTKYTIIDGFRRVEDVLAFQKLPSFTLIHITAPEKLRFERLKKRKQNPGDAKVTWRQFKTQDNAETEKTIAAAAKKARYEIENAGSLKDFYKKLDAIVSKIK